MIGSRGKLALSGKNFIECAMEKVVRLCGAIIPALFSAFIGDSRPGANHQLRHFHP
jgi:hypothetical protein